VRNFRTLNSFSSYLARLILNYSWFHETYNETIQANGKIRFQNILNIGTKRVITEPAGATSYSAKAVFWILIVPLSLSASHFAYESKSI